MRQNPMRVCVVFNPSAGIAEQMATLRDRLAGRPGVTVHEPTDARDATRLAADAAREGYDLVVAAGGDGTVHAVVNGLVADPGHARLGVLPLGTGNDLCRTLAIPLDPLTALAALDAGAERTIDLIRVEIAGAVTHCVNVATGGFSGRVAAGVTAERKEFWGPLAYLRGVGGELPTPAGYRAILCFDDGPAEDFEALNVVVANGRTAAGGLPVAPGADPEDGLLNVVIVRSGRLIDLSHIAARLMAGDYLGDTHVVHRTARRVQVESDPAMPFSIDGEAVEAERVTFAVLPRALRVVAGPGYSPSPQPSPVRVAPTASRGRRLGRSAFRAVAAVLGVMRQLTWFYAVGMAVAAAALLGFAELSEEMLEGDVQPANVAVLRFLHAHATPTLDRTALALSRLGGIAGTTALGAASVAFLLWRRAVFDAITVLLVLLGGTGLVIVLKHTFRQPRPDLFASLAPEHTFSFPSGHALMAVCLYGCLATMLVLEEPRRWWRWAGAVAFVVLALGIGWSRLYLGVHWLSDVGAGGLVAVFWVACCLMARHYARPRLAGRTGEPADTEMAWPS